MLGNTKYQNPVTLSDVTINNMEEQRTHSRTQSRTTRNKSGSCGDCCIGGCAIIGILLIFGMLLAIPIAELVMRHKYYDDIVCHSPIMSLQQWLLVDGVFGIITATLFTITLAGVVAALSQSSDDLTCFFVGIGIILYPCYVFNLIWLILGSIVFWRDCPNAEPTAINTFMYAVLIINYVMLYIQIQQSRQKSDKS